MRKFVLLAALAGFIPLSAVAQTGAQIGSGQVWGNSTAARAPGKSETVPALLDRALGASAATGPIQRTGGGAYTVSTTLLSGVLGPTSTTLGNIGFWNSADGTKLGAAPAFQGGNPSNAALYSPLAIPGAGNDTYNAMQVGVGTAVTAADVPRPTNRMIQGVVGTTVIPLAETNMTAYGVMGYGQTDSTALSNAIGVGGWGFGNNNASSIWAMAGSIHNKPFTASVGLDSNSMIGLEIDVNIWKKTAGVEPTIPQLHGIVVTGSGDSTANQGDAIEIGKLNVSTGAKWTNGVYSIPGASVNAFVAGPTASTGVNLNSQNIILQGVNNVGTTLTYTIFGDNGSDLFLKTPNSGSVLLGDGAGNYLATAPTVGGAKLIFPALNGSSAGAIINDTSGNIASAAAGAGKVLAGATPAFTATPTLGVAGSVVGSLAFANATSGSVTLQPATGALGSAVATLPAGTYNVVGDSIAQTLTNKTIGAATLSGTISGGGNQINNVIIGASTPLAGTFTTLTAGGGGQTATIGPGGTGALNAFLKLNGANASSQGAYIKFTKNDVSTESWFLGHVSAIEATGTSSDLEYFNQNTSVRTMRMNIATDLVTFGAGVTVTGTLTGNGGVNAPGVIVGATGITSTGPITYTPVAVSSLPTCNAGADGARAFVNNNATATAFAGAVTNGGANHHPVYCDGSASAWKQG